ncbi:MAG: FAD-dependent oxidoreductase [Paracoccaceae bacterium]|nr:FAD-dependent oxidoreductase [Paracoccaceae bacterium]
MQGTELAQRFDHDVIIVGAGIIGAAVAYHLAIAGLRVAVVDAIGPAAAASGASDGAVSVASKKPGTMARLATASLLYSRDLAAGGPLQGAYEPRPAHIFGTGAAELAAMDALIEKLSVLAGPVQVIGDGGPDRLPGLGPDVERLLTLEGEGHMPGHRAVRAYMGTPGITPIWPAPVLGFESDDHGVTLRLADRRLRTRHLVLATGVSSSKLIPGLPILPRSGQLLITDRGPEGELSGALTAAAYLVAKTASAASTPGSPVVLDPLATGQYLIGSSREDHGDASHVDFATLRRILTRAVGVWPALRNRRVIRAFAGVRAAVPDGLPIVGPLADAPRVFVATGFEGDGICLSALIGREVALMVRGIAPDAALASDLGSLSPSRFAPALRIEGAA